MFRFEDLEVWELSVEISDPLIEIADQLEKNNKYRFAEQLRGATLSISNTIAEGSAMKTDKEFSRYPNIARSSSFENANMSHLFDRQDLLDAETKEKILNDLDRLSKKITALKATL